MQLMEATTITSRRSNSDRVPVAQHVDFFVDRRRLSDVGVAYRNVGLRLVVVVVRDEVLNRIQGKLPQLVAELAAEVLL